MDSCLREHQVVKPADGAGVASLEPPHIEFSDRAGGSVSTAHSERGEAALSTGLLARWRRRRGGGRHRLGGRGDAIPALGLLRVAALGELGKVCRDGAAREPSLLGDLAGGQRLAAGQRSEH